MSFPGFGLMRRIGKREIPLSREPPFAQAGGGVGKAWAAWRGQGPLRGQFTCGPGRGLSSWEGAHVGMLGSDTMPCRQIAPTVWASPRAPRDPGGIEKRGTVRRTAPEMALPL